MLSEGRQHSIFLAPKPALCPPAQHRFSSCHALCRTPEVFCLFLHQYGLLLQSLLDCLTLGVRFVDSIYHPLSEPQNHCNLCGSKCQALFIKKPPNRAVDTLLMKSYSFLHRFSVGNHPRIIFSASSWGPKGWPFSALNFRLKAMMSSMVASGAVKAPF